MADVEHLDILKKGAEEWNSWRFHNRDMFPNLKHATLRHANLNFANLKGADLENAYLNCASMNRADLSNANLSGADLSQCNFTSANLRGAHLKGAQLSGASFNGADLSGANLTCTRLKSASFAGADLSHADLNGAHLETTQFGNTILGCVGLPDTYELCRTIHTSRSFLLTTTLEDSNGRLPEEFLRGCGLSEWEIQSAKLYDPRLSASQIAELQQRIFDERAKGFFLCGAFISYSHANSAFANQVYERLKGHKVNVWLDKHDLVSGPLAKQVDSAIRVNDVVLSILSQDSVNSDWVKWELKRARRLKKEQGRDILCPIALDDSWKVAADGDPNWNVLTDYNILDFSDWESKESFNCEFEKLIKGITRYYANDV